MSSVRTPQQLAQSGTEHGHQVALFAYARMAYLFGWQLADLWVETGEVPKLPPCDQSCGQTTPKGCTCRPAIPALEWFHAIPNGGSRGDSEKSRVIRGSQLKAEGVKQGVADTFLPWPIVITGSGIVYCGLYIEMKRPSEKPKRASSMGGMSEEQILFKQYAQNQSYGFATCYSWEEAVKVLKSYIEWKG